MADRSVSELKLLFVFSFFLGKIFSDGLARNLDRQMYRTVQKKGNFEIGSGKSGPVFHFTVLINYFL